MAVRNIEIIAASFALVTPCSAMACPPTPQPNPDFTSEQLAAFRQAEEDRYQGRVRAYERYALDATGIAYVVVEKTIGGNWSRKPPHKAQAGVIRILHTYRGPLKESRKINIEKAGEYQVGGCPSPPPVINRGVYGVAAITISPDGKSNHLKFFLPPEMLKKFFDEGVIKSAQAPTNAPG